MSNEAKLLNKSERKGIITIDLEKLLPDEDQIIQFNLEDYLFQGLILREKDFRLAMESHDWTQYQDKYFFITCPPKAIVPIWAYMLISTYAVQTAKLVSYIDKEEIYDYLINENLSSFDIEPFRNARVVIKGCGNKKILPATYVKITALLQPVAKSLMYGEPCSTVPIYKSR